MRLLAGRRVKKKDSNTEPHEACHDVVETRRRVLCDRGLFVMVVHLW